MLIQFRFRNFKSFKDDTILDLSATKITEHSSRLVSIGNEKILPVAAVYGANASGKSNLIEAFRYMATYVVDSFSYGGDSDDRKRNKKKQKHAPFLFDPSSRIAESSFEVYFTETSDSSGKSYNYGFALRQDGVVEEWLNSKAKTAREYRPVFYRNGGELDLSGLPAKSQELIRIALNKESLVVSLGAKLKIDKLKKIRDWFSALNFTNFGDPIENALLSSLVPSGFAADESVRDKVVAYFSSFDPSIIGFNVETVKGDDDQSDFLKIDAVHRAADGGQESIPLNEESAGTLKMFALFPALQDTLERGSVLFIDELNSRLHPLLVRNFLLMFLNPELNPNHAQLVFTTHDAWQLSSKLLRRDEIWFTEKDGNGVSTLYSLADFVDEDGVKIRKDEDYERNYLLGKYGAVPSLKCFDFVGAE